MRLRHVGRRPFRIGAGAAVAAVLVVVPAAHAAQKAPNPGFEDDCGGIPCQWTAVSPATISRDTSTFHGATGASLRLTPGAAAVTGDATSSCVTGVQPGSVSAGFWYRSADAAVTSMGLFMRFYTGSNCTGFISGTGPLGLVTPDGVWRERTPSTFTVPANTNSMDVGLNVNCLGPCAGAAGNFDDLNVDVQNVVAVKVSSLAAERSGKGVNVRWRTRTEVDMLGFHVYRSRARSWQRLTRALIVAKGSVSGAAYRYVDKTARRGVSYRYRIRAVNQDGTTAWFGPVRVI